jgi:hypothetical protein
MLKRYNARYNSDDDVIFSVDHSEYEDYFPSLQQALASVGGPTKKPKSSSSQKKVKWLLPQCWLRSK